METKIFGVLGLSILALVLFMSLGSAAVNFTVSPMTLTFTPSDSSESFIITNLDVAELLNVTLPPTPFVINIFDVPVTFDFIGNLTAINASVPRTITVTPQTSIDFSDFELAETFSESLLIENVANSDENLSIIIKVQNDKFCEYENPANLELEIDKINVNEGFGDDDEFWYPLDEVEIDVEIKDPDYDVEDIEIEFCLYDIDEGKCILDEGDIDIGEDDFDVDEGDDLTTTLSFQVDPDELYIGNKEYRIYVKATGTIDDKNAGTDDDKKTCDSDFKNIEIRTDEKFVIIDDITLDKETVQCGEELRITADVWNVGDEDLDDDDVFIRVLNTDLNIDEKIEFASGIDYMDKEELDLIFQIPKNLEEKRYIIEFIVYDDEDMYDKHIYENDEGDEAEYSVYVKVEGSCIVEEAPVSVSTTIESGGKAGEELIVKVSVTNTGDSTATHTLNVAGYTGWADSAELSPNELTLTAGQAADVLITFNVNEDAVGKESSFNIIFSGDASATQPVSGVLIEKSGWGITGLNIKENPYVWGIGLFNIILIIVIVIVAVRLARK